MNRIMLGAGLLVCATAVSAAEITLYQKDNFRGRRVMADSEMTDLSSAGYNDTASSVVVRSGSWQLCDDANFRGRCVTLTPGQYPSMSQVGLNDGVASVREFNPPPAVVPHPPVVTNGAGRVVLYEGPNYTGRAVTVDRPVVNFENIGFNDRARSAVVYEGTWELCLDAQFSGRCALYRPGEYANLGAGLEAQVSSARPMREPLAAAPAAPPPSVAPAPAARAVLYEGRDFRGRSIAIDGRLVRDLADSGFNDRASSLHVEEGYWMFCSDANFEGECRTFGPGDYASLPAELNNRVSSARRISEHYPYRDRPTWGAR